MKITLVALGKHMPHWVTSAYQEYVKRFPADFQLQLIEMSMGKRTKGVDIVRLQRREGEQMLAAIPKGSLVVALEVTGQQWDTSELAGRLQQWRDERRHLCLLIGGPEGLASECLKKADLRWSLSPLTFPHPLVRVIVVEQLYRAWSVLTGHPYHRD